MVLQVEGYYREESLFEGDRPINHIFLTNEIDMCKLGFNGQDTSRSRMKSEIQKQVSKIEAIQEQRMAILKNMEVLEYSQEKKASLLREYESKDTLDKLLKSLTQKAEQWE